jgi:hypothetical protein
MPGERNHRASGLLAALGVVLAIYLFPPIVLLIPIDYARAQRWISKAAALRSNRVFVPHAVMSRYCPPFGELLRKEMEFCRSHELVYDGLEKDY